MTYRLILATLLAIGVAKSSFASQLRFDYPEVDLPSATVWSIAQDNKGMMWFGTSNGLVSYDGFKTRHYFHNAQPNSPSSNFIRHFKHWKGNTAIIGHNDGTVEIFDTTFQNSQILEIPQAPISQIKVVSNSSFWLVNSDGLYLVYEKNSHSEKNCQSDLAIEFYRAPPNVHLTAFEHLTPNHLLVGSKQGLLEFHHSTKHFSNVINGTQNFKVRAIKKHLDTFWIGTENTGLLQYHTSTKQVQLVSEKLANLFVINLETDALDNLWVGTKFKGLFQLKNNRLTHHFQNESNHPDSIRDNIILSTHVDRSGVLWIGSFDKGVGKTVPLNQQFGLLNNSKTSLHCLPTNTIYSIAEYHQKILLGTQYGLFEYNLINQDCSLIELPITNSETVLSLLLDDADTLWIGTSNSVINFDLNNNQVIDIFHSKGLKSNFILTQDSLGNLLVGNRNGVYKKEPLNQQFHKVPIHGDKDLWVTGIAITRNHNLYVGSKIGLFIYDNQQRDLRTVGLDNPSLQTHISAMVANEHNLWLSTVDQALLKMDTDSHLIETVDLNTRHSGFEAASIVPFNNNLWISSNQGIFNYNTASKKTTHYSKVDGLQSNFFIKGSAFKAENNQVIFGGRNGLNRFSPKALRFPPTKFLVGISDLFYFDRTIDSVNSNQKLEALSKTDQKLLFDHNDLMFGFEFIAYDTIAPLTNSFRYQIVGHNDDRWFERNADSRRLTLTSMPAGSYTLRVRGFNHHGHESQNIAELQFDVLAAPWLTKTAFTIYVLLICALVAMFYRIRTQSLISRARHLEQEVANRTQSLEIEKSKVERLLSKKEDEFANISHEFRTPLTLVLGPLSQLRKSINQPKIIEKIDIVQRNAIRLLRMVDQIMELEKFRVHHVSNQQYTPLDQAMFFIVQPFRDLAKEKSITIDMSEMPTVDIHMSNQAFERVILNLLSNALKYTPGPGLIRISAVCDDQQVILSIQDSGIGIPKQKQDEVFERFNRVLDTSTQNISGSGIGLALVKEMVELQKGTISLESEVNEGTLIRVTLPYSVRTKNQSKASSYQSDSSSVNQELYELHSQLHTDHSKPTLSLTTPNKNPTHIDEKPQILIVEDNHELRSYIAELLLDDYDILQADNGVKGFEMTESQIPDLVISDIMMPMMDGFALVKKIKSTPLTSHIPVILLTAKDDRASQLKGWSEKADDYITKPFDEEALKLRISNLLLNRILIWSHKKSDMAYKPIKLGNLETETTLNLDEAIAEQHAITIPTETIQMSSEQAAIHSKFVEKLEKIIETNYSNTDLKVSQLASQAALSERQLFRKIKACFNMTPSEYLRNYRLNKATELLNQGMSANQVAFEVGFSSHTYFTRCFKTVYNCTPSEYRSIFSLQD